MNVWTKYMLASVVAVGSTGALAKELIHDADYYVLEAQHKEQWIATDKTVDAKLAAFREQDVSAIGVSGVDAGLIRARRRPPRFQDDGGTIDYGCVGDIVSVKVSVGALPIRLLPDALSGTKVELSPL